MGLIFYMSSQNGDESSQTSGTIMNLLIYATQAILGEQGIISLQEWFPVLETIIRKCAHMTEYGILLLLLWRTPYLRTVQKSNVTKAILICLAICFTYAVSDECHQLFVSDRAGCFTDVLIDTAGAGIAACFLACRYKLKKK